MRDLNDERYWYIALFIFESFYSVHFRFIAGVGINCTDPYYILPLIQVIRKVSTKKYIVVYPNSGEIYEPNTKKWLNPKEAVSFEELTRDWVKAGANVIGGCCRTSPKTIERMQLSIQNLQ